jgi:hypothetical protein
MTKPWVVLVVLCVSVRSALAGMSYEVPVVLPASDKAGQVIRSPGDWAAINDPGKRIFVVEPGDYRGVGTITLTASGTAVAPRYLMLKSAAEDDATHASQLPEAKQAVIGSLDIEGADFWIVDRISIVDTPLYTSPVLIRDNSTDNILNRMRIENIAFGCIIRHGCHRNVIQNSLIGGQRQEWHDGKWVYLERIGLGLSRSGSDERAVRIEDTVFVNNEIYNMTDGIQLIASPLNDPRYVHPVDYPGTVIAGNEIYITPEMYTDGAGHFTATGLFAAAENGIDLKAGSRDPNRPVIVIGNRMWGFRYTDTLAAPSSGSRGVALTGHQQTQNIVIEDNVIFDSNWGISGTHWHNTSVRNNIIACIGQPTGRANTGYGIQIGADALNLTDSVIEGNLISGILINGLYAASPSHVVSFSFENNVIINGAAFYVQATLLDATADYNRYYNTIPDPDLIGTHDEIYATAEESGYRDLCLKVRKWTRPETKRLSYARPPEHEADGD